MEKLHPKRRHDKDNPYTIWKEKDGTCHLSFLDGEGVLRELKIPLELYQLFDQFELEDLAHLNEVDRHGTDTEVDGKRVERLLSQGAKPLQAERQVEERELLRQALAALSMTQQKRLILYTVHGWTFEEIARDEYAAPGRTP